MFPPMYIAMAYASYRIGQNQLSVDALRAQTSESAKKISDAIKANTDAIIDLHAAFSKEGELLRLQLLEMHQAQMANRDVACPYCNQLISRKALICNQCQGILNFGSWDFIRVALLYRPELIMRDKETIAELQATVKEIEIEVLRIATIEDERKRLELENRLQIEKASAEAELKAIRKKEADRVRLELEQKAEFERLAKDKARIVSQAKSDLKELHKFTNKLEDDEILNPASALALVRKVTNLSINQYQNSLTRAELAEFSSYLLNVGDAVMTNGKLTESAASAAISIFEIADKFAAIGVPANICRTYYLSRQFKKCVVFADKALLDPALTALAFDGILLDQLKSQLILKTAKIGNVERARERLRDKNDYQNKLVIAAGFFICGDAEQALSIRDSITPRDLNEARFLYEPDFEENHEEIARFDEMVYIVIDS
jgi:hypothetical protein